MAENKEKKSLKSLNMADLVNYEKAARLLCIKYENSFKGYDGSIRENFSKEDYNKFEKYNNFHMAILDEFEERINEIDK